MMNQRIISALQKRGTCATEDPGADFLHEVARLQSDEANPAGSQAREPAGKG
jgi:hypothetical protein